MAELLPCALILDRAMAQDGEVQSVLRELPYDLPVVSFSFPGSARHPRGLPAGVSDYLVKPIARQDLAEAVRALGPGVRNLLVVDDDPGMVRFVTLATQDGYRLAAATTGREALVRLREDRPDAVLLDLALPDISGWDVLREMQEEPGLNEVPVILITAHDWPQMQPAGEGEALRVTMRRPLSRKELTAVLGCLLDTIQPAYPAVSAGPVHAAGPSG
jgi:DNA-binding response OmpR family regulator